VRIVETPQPDGSVQRSYIVDIPGTKVWPGPGFNPDVNDTGTNLHAVANEVTTYQRGVEEALRRAGAQANDPVLLIGHSQGGIVAANAARDFTQAGSFNVTHIVTAGSPVAQVNVPEQVQVLSIENRHDIVPRLDARTNPDVSNWVTVVVERQRGTVGDNHGLDMTYVGAAEGVDRSDDPSVRAYLEGAGAFFNGQTVTTARYRVERVP
jgi:pimeloyl-ACP methyl ester carboxylesterase